MYNHENQINEINAPRNDIDYILLGFFEFISINIRFGYFFKNFVIYGCNTK